MKRGTGVDKNFSGERETLVLTRVETLLFSAISAALRGMPEGPFFYLTAKSGLTQSRRGRREGKDLVF
jgi:hypothetical protein